MTVRFVLTTDIDAPAAAVFERSLDIDEHLRSMARHHERAVAGVTHGTIGLGEEVTWRARHLGIRWTMTTRITALHRPTRFVDEQVRGPFRWFRHEHRFEDVDGRTVMVDAVAFEAPFGVVGRGVERLVLARHLRTLILDRNAHLRTVAGHVT